MAQTLGQLHGQDKWEKLVSSTASLLNELGNHPILNAEVYQKIEQSCLLMLGDKDKMVSREETIFAYRKLLNGNMAILPGTIHPLEKMDKELVSFHLKNFFRD